MPRLQSFGWLAVALFASIVAGSRSVHSQEPVRSAPLLVQPIAVPLRLIRVPTTVGNRTGWFLVDTGASCTVVDTELVKDLPKALKAEPLNISGRVCVCDMYEIDGLSLGTINCPTLRQVAAMDLSTLSRELGYRVDGAIGMDVLAKFVVRIDPDQGMLEIFAPNVIRYDAKTAMRIGMDAGRRPTIEVSLSGDERRFAFVIDTGCLFTGTMDVPTLRPLLEEKLITSTRILLDRMGADGRAEKVSALYCPNMQIGPHELRRPIFIPSVDNVLGIDCLARFRVVLDFPNALCVLEPSNLFDSPDRHDYSGLVLDQDGQGRRVISGLVPDSAAAKHGLLVGDELIGVDDRPIDEIGERELFRLMTMVRPKKTTFAFVRGRSVMRVVLP